jgi:hypothetical protein
MDLKPESGSEQHVCKLLDESIETKAETRLPSTAALTFGHIPRPEDYP